MHFAVYVPQCSPRVGGLRLVHPSFQEIGVGAASINVLLLTPVTAVNACTVHISLDLALCSVVAPISHCVVGCSKVAQVAGSLVLPGLVCQHALW